jgi:hypothetical protein
MSVARVLAAATPKVLPYLCQALSDYDVLATTSLNQAITLVRDERIDIFVIAVHFDDSRSIDLVNAINGVPGHSGTPLIVFRTLSSQYTDMLRQTLSALKSVGKITDYYEFESDSEAWQKLRTAVAMTLDRDLADGGLRTLVP